MRPIELIERVSPTGRPVICHLEWDDTYPTSTPFWLWKQDDLRIQRGGARLTFPLRIVWWDDGNLGLIAVRTDEYPLMWMWWWLFIRVEETLRITWLALIFVLNAWGLENPTRTRYPSLKDLRKKQRPNPYRYPDQTFWEV